MPNPTPQFDHIPLPDGGAKLYQAAGKLKDRNAIITGGDSGIGRATAILFAMEGADSLIAYLPDEEDDAQETKRMVEKHGRACHLLATDLTDQANCKKVIDVALEKLGGINILFNNHAYQMMTDDIHQLSECVISHSICPWTILTHDSARTGTNGCIHLIPTSTPFSSSLNTRCLT